MNSFEIFVKTKLRSSSSSNKIKKTILWQQYVEFSCQTKGKIKFYKFLRSLNIKESKTHWIGITIYDDEQFFNREFMFGEYFEMMSNDYII